MNVLRQLDAFRALREARSCVAIAQATLASDHDEYDKLVKVMAELTRIAIAIEPDQKTVDEVRAKLPARCGYIVDNYTNDHDERICGHELPCPRHK